MPPTYFQIVAQAFERVYKGLPTEDRDEKILAALNLMSRRYSRVALLGGPDFADEYVRAGYLFRYVAAHSDMITDAINWSKELRRAISADKVMVTSLGGGPGTDVLAIAKYAIENNLPSKYYFKLVDKETAWADTWSDVDQVLADHFHCSRAFLDVDVTDQASWSKQKAIFQADLFTSSWFLSEITKDLSAALPFFDAMIGNAKPGALFLIVDFAHSTVTDLVDGLAETYDLGEPLLDKRYDFKIHRREQKAELGEFLDRFGSPKLTGDVIIRLYRKP